MIIFSVIFFTVNIYGQNKSETDLVLQKAINDLGSEKYETRVQAKKILDNAGLRAVPFLRKVTTSDDLEIKEYADNKISHAFSYNSTNYTPEKIIGVDIKIKTYEKYNREYFAFIKGLLLDAYKKTVANESAYEANVKTLIDLFTESCLNEEMANIMADVYHLGRSSRKDEMGLRKKINEISEAGCSEAVFVFIKHYLYFRWGDHRFSPDEFQNKASEIVSAGGSLYFESVSTAFVTNFKSKRLTNKDIKILNENYFKVWVKVSKDDAMKNEVFQKRYVRWFEFFKDSIPIVDLEKALVEISENIGKDTWVVLTLKATILNKKAWAARGGSYASEVKDESWKLFNDYLAQSKEAAVAAYQLQKDSKELCNLMITNSMANPNGDKIRLWFERAMAVDIYNKQGFANFIWASLPRWGGSVEEMVSLGREFLLINQPNIYAAWNYISMVSYLKNEIKDVYHYPGLFQDVEWAVEQLVANKSIHSHLFNNELAIAAFYYGSYDKCNQAILDTKGLFSTSWVNIFEVDGIFIENFASLYVKYKDKKAMMILKQLQEKSVPLDLKDFFVFLESEIASTDQAKMVSVLIRLLKANVMHLDSKIIDSLFRFGYQEVVLITYYHEYLSGSNEQLKDKLIEKFGKNTIDSLEATKNTNGSDAATRKNLIETITAIYKKDLGDGVELNKNHDYQKAVLRGLILICNRSNHTEKLKDQFAPYINKFQDIGDGGEFISSHIYASIQKSVANGLCDIYKNYFFNANEHQFAWVDEAIKKLLSINDEDKLIEEILALQKRKGKPVLTYALIDFLKSKNKLEQAENLKQMVFYCISAYHLVYRDECLIQSLGLAPGYSKEAFQMGLRAIKEYDCNAMSYLSAYHVFQLGHFHLAYEMLCQANGVKEHGSPVVLNKKRFLKSIDLRDFVVEVMLKSKDLPEYIRYNLTDQFKK